jgi:hypothetical protein
MRDTMLLDYLKILNEVITRQHGISPVTIFGNVTIFRPLIFYFLVNDFLHCK